MCDEAFKDNIAVVSRFSRKWLFKKRIHKFSVPTIPVHCHFTCSHRLCGYNQRRNKFNGNNKPRISNQW